MKRLLVLILCVNFLLSCKKESDTFFPPNTYEINGTAKGVYNGVRAYLKEVVNGKEFTTDTAVIINEKFSFTGQVNNPKIQILTINSVNNSFPIILESGIIDIEIYKDSMRASKIVNSPKINNVYNQYISGFRKKANFLNSIREKMEKDRLNGDAKSYKINYEESLKVIEQIDNYPFEFIKKNEKSILSILILESLIKDKKNININSLKKSMISIGSIFNENEYNKSINRSLNIYLSKREREERLDIGKVAPNFSGTTPKGKTISLNDIKGKATIIDFWAAWCAPCRRENPNVVKVYEKYHDKGLEIISIGLDGRAGQNNPRVDWLKAIKDDKLNWHHISNLNYFNEPAAKIYNINAIPATFILDENGIIVSKRLRGQALENKIAELLN